MSDKLIIDVQQDDPVLLTHFKYPGGETQVRLTEAGHAKLIGAKDIHVVSRITGAEGLVQTTLAVDAIFHQADEDASIKLDLPYLPYGRADRRFTVGDTFGLRVFLGMLRSLPVNHVRTLDAHSVVGEQIFPRLMSVDADPFIAEAVQRFAEFKETGKVVVLYPDKGARDRYSRVKMPAHLKVQIEYCEKERDPETGKLTGFKVPDIPADVPALIVDDICDGGGTFLGISGELPYSVGLGLYVTHGIFSKGFGQLGEHFEKIYTTDSFPSPMVNSYSHGKALVERLECLSELTK